MDGPLAALTCQTGFEESPGTGAIHERGYDNRPGSSQACFFQAHGIDAQGTTVLHKRLRRGQVLAFFSRIPRCVVGLEACATAHYWARELGALGHEVRLMPAQYVKAYIKRNKHDAADAEAICEAAQRPTMRFVPVKTAEQQATQLLHRGREQLVRQRTMLVNALRAITFPSSSTKTLPSLPNNLSPLRIPALLIAAAGDKEHRNVSWVVEAFGVFDV